MNGLSPSAGATFNDNDRRSAVTDVYLVVSPAQLITALEAVHVFPCSRRELVILTTPPFPEQAFAPILRDSSWARVTPIEIRQPDEVGLRLDSFGLLKRKSFEYKLYSRQRKRREQLNRIARLLSPARNLFIGNYLSPAMRHFANTLKPEVVYALDDGTDVLRVPGLRQRREAPRERASRWDLRRLAHQWLHDWDDARIERIGLFTSYDVVAAEGDFVVPHAFEFLRGCAATIPRSDDILFLGQPLVEDEYLTKAEHEENLTRVVEYFQGHPLVYVPHRRESESSINFIAHQLRLPVRRFDVPIEYQIVMRGPRPQALASFFSSAIENARRIFGDDITLFAFAPVKTLVRNGPAFVRDAYEQFKRGEPNCVRVIEI